MKKASKDEPPIISIVGPAVPLGREKPGAPPTPSLLPPVKLTFDASKVIHQNLILFDPNLIHQHQFMISNGDQMSNIKSFLM